MREILNRSLINDIDYDCRTALIKKDNLSKVISVSDNLYYIDNDNKLIGIGVDSYGSIKDIPLFEKFTTISSNGDNVCGINTSGNCIIWGNGFSSAYYDSSKIFIQCSAGTEGAIYLASDGTIKSYGNSNFYGQVSNTPKDGDYIQVARTDNTALALKNTGYIVAWGNSNIASLIPKDVKFKYINGGYKTAVGIDENGFLHVWHGSTNNLGIINNKPTDGGYVSVSVGYFCCTAIKDDGTIVIWGEDKYNQLSMDIDYSDTVQVSVGTIKSAIIKKDGTILLYGSNKLQEIKDGYVFNNSINILKDSNNYLYSIEKNNRIKKLDITNPIYDDFINEGFLGVKCTEKTNNIEYIQNKLYPTEIGVLSSASIINKNIKNINIFNINDDGLKLNHQKIYSSSNNNNIAIRSDGSLYAWGILNIDPNNSYVIRDYPKTGKYKEAMINGSNGIALTEDGSIIVWGDDEMGQISNIPKDIKFKNISIYNRCMCGLTIDGEIKLWGDTTSYSYKLPIDAGYENIVLGSNICIAIKNNIMTIFGRKYDEYYDKFKNYINSKKVKKAIPNGPGMVILDIYGNLEIICNEYIIKNESDIDKLKNNKYIDFDFKSNILVGITDKYKLVTFSYSPNRLLDNIDTQLKNNSNIIQVSASFNIITILRYDGTIQYIYDKNRDGYAEIVEFLPEYETGYYKQNFLSDVDMYLIKDNTNKKILKYIPYNGFEEVGDYNNIVIDIFSSSSNTRDQLSYISKDEWNQLGEDVEILKYSAFGIADFSVISTLNNEIEPIKIFNNPKILSFSKNELDSIISVLGEDSVRYSISKDNIEFYKYITEDASFVLINDSKDGNTKEEVSAIPSSEWYKFLNDGRAYTSELIIKSHIANQTDEKTFVRNISVEYVENQGPILTNQTLSLDTIHKEYTILNTKISDLEGDNIEYRVLIKKAGEEEFYVADDWAICENDHTIIKAYNKPYFHVGDNTIRIEAKDQRGVITNADLNLVMSNENPLLAFTYNEFGFVANIGDPESDKVSLQVSINGEVVQAWTPFMNTPKEFKYDWDTRYTPYGMTSNIKIEVKDEFDGLHYETFDIIGAYKSLLFTDMNGDYFTSDRGDILQLLDLGTLIAGQNTEPVKIKLVNSTNEVVNNISIQADKGNLPENASLMLTDDLQIPPSERIEFAGTMNHLDEKEFYVSVHSKPGRGVIGGKFALTTEGNIVK